MPKELMYMLNIDRETYSYEPIIYMSDFWCLNKYLIPLNDTVNEVNLTLNFAVYSQYFMLVQKNLEANFKRQEEMGL